MKGSRTRRSRIANAATWPGSPYRAGSLAEPRPLVLAPYQELADASAALGHNFLTRDDDGPARRMPPFIVSDGKELPSLGVAAALRAGEFAPRRRGGRGHVLRIGDRARPAGPPPRSTAATSGRC